ncbi:hypothetical protein MBANPS3_012398 [Mucor bainieri]
MIIWFGLPVEIAQLIIPFWLGGARDVDLFLMDPFSQLMDAAEDTKSKMSILRYIIKFVGSYVSIFVPPSLMHVSYVEDAGPVRYWMTSGKLGDYWKSPEELQECEWFVTKKRFFLMHDGSVRKYCRCDSHHSSRRVMKEEFSALLNGEVTGYVLDSRCISQQSKWMMKFRQCRYRDDLWSLSLAALEDLEDEGLYNPRPSGADIRRAVYHFFAYPDIIDEALP